MANKPTPILFTIPNFITAGSGRAMLNIIERLDKNKFSPAVCVLRKGGNLDKEVERLGIPFIEAPFTVKAKPYLTFLFRALKAAQIFKKYRFKIWHSFHYLNDYTEPIIAKMAGAEAWVYTKKNMNWYRRAWWLRSFLADGIAAQNTDMLKEFFKKKKFYYKTRLIPRGVNLEHFDSKLESNYYRKKLNILGNEILIGCVAHLVPVKGHPTLLEALLRTSNAQLIIAGKENDQSYSLELKKIVKNLSIEDRVHFLGDVQDVSALLNEVDIVVLPTWAKWRMEGCPVALLEAMACQKACVATDIPGSRDIIVNHESGILVPSEDVDSLAKALNTLIASKDLRLKLGQQARERIKNEFSLEKEVKKHEKFYEEVLNES